MASFLGGDTSSLKKVFLAHTFIFSTKDVSGEWNGYLDDD